MADPVPRQPNRRERSPGGGPPTEAAPAVTGWGPPATRAPRDTGQPAKAPYFPPWDVAGAAPTRAGAPPRGARGGAPAGAPSRPAGPAQAPAAQRPRPPAGAGAPAGRSGPATATAARGQGRAVGRDMRNRLVVRRVNAVSVLKVSAVFYFGVLVVMLVAGAVLWNVAAALGIIDDLDKAIRSLFALSTFKLHPLVALGWTAVIGGALCFLGVVVNVFAAIMYNLISDMVGGVQVTVTADKRA
jgi:Transmembrane domain of unknown function (DUF3566)